MERQINSNCDASSNFCKYQSSFEPEGIFQNRFCLVLLPIQDRT